MKKGLGFLIILGIIIGTMIALRGEQEEVIENLPQTSGDTEIYIGELSLPWMEIDSYNPILTQNKPVSDILKLIYEPLFDWNEENQLEPKLASEWSERDELSWIVKINTNATWHSGKPFSVEDVLFTYHAIANAEQSVYQENIKNIVNMERMDDHAILITLATRDKMLPCQLTFPILPQYYLENDMENLLKLKHPIGTGPYQYVSLTEDEKIMTLQANSTWWNPEPIKLRTIHLYEYPTYGEAMKAFKTMEVDVIPTTMIDWQKKFGAIGLNAYLYESNEFETLVPNTQNEILRENSVRRMLLESINSASIVEQVYSESAVVSNYPMPSYSHFNDYDTVQNYDVEKAKQLLVNAGWSNTTGVWQKEIEGKRVTLQFRLLVNRDSTEKMAVADHIVEDLKEVGVTVTVVAVSQSELERRLQEGDFELAIVSLQLPCDRNLFDLLRNDSAYNYAKIQSEEVEKIWQEINMEKQEEQFAQLQAWYRQEVPYIGLYYHGYHLLTNQGVKGEIHPTAWNVYQGITSWCK